MRMDNRERGRRIVRRRGKREGTTHQKVSRIGNVVARKGGGGEDGVMTDQQRQVERKRHP